MISSDRDFPMAFYEACGIPLLAGIAGDNLLAPTNLEAMAALAMLTRTDTFLQVAVRNSGAVTALVATMTNQSEAALEVVATFAQSLIDGLVAGSTRDPDAARALCDAGCLPPLVMMGTLLANAFAAYGRNALQSIFDVGGDDTKDLVRRTEGASALLRS